LTRAAVDGQNVLRCDIRHSITWSARTSMAVGNVFAEETLARPNRKETILALVER
jgi:hypothetical protein